MTLFDSEKGAILIQAILLMSILALMAIAAGTSSSIEMMISANDRSGKTSFYAAEAGLSHGAASAELYGEKNITIDAPVEELRHESEIGSFEVRATYKGIADGRNVLRGKGFSADEFKGHSYLFESVGFGPDEATSRVSAEGFRVGY